MNVALPSIAAGLRVSEMELELAVVGYTLMMAMMVVPAGRLGDAYGRRKLFLIGVAAFGLTSLLVGAAVDGTMLFIIRLLQGAAAGLIVPQTTGLIQQMFQGGERAKAFGRSGMIAAMAGVAGPLIAGFSIQLFGADLGWRGAFWVNVPIALAVLPLGLKTLPAHTGRSEQARLDPLGLLLVAIAAVGIMLPFMAAEAGGGGAAISVAGLHGPLMELIRWLPVLLAALAVWLLFRHEPRYQKRTAAAIFDPALLGDGGFRTGILISAGYYAGFGAIGLIGAVMLQQGLGYSALHAAALMIPYVIGSAAGANLAGKLVNQYGRRVVTWSLGLMAIGMLILDLVMGLATVDCLQYGMIGATLIAGFGSGAALAANTTLTLATVPERIGGVAGAMLQIFQQLGWSIGIAIGMSMYYAYAGPVGHGPAGPQHAAFISLWFSIGMIALTTLLAIYDQRRAAREVVRNS
jgi:MFS family permease